MRKTLLMMILVPLSIFAMAQGTVTGTVTDSDGSGLPGVNVVEKGTTNGTATDIDGNYTLSVGADATLVFSFIGYETQEVSVGSRSTVSVTMSLDVQQLSEVVVIGYGEVEADDATGAITSVSAEDFNGGVIASPEQLFQGRAAGVQITTNSGEPGGGVNIRIRGTSSIRSGNNPLFVVDGVPLSGGETSSGVSGPLGSSSSKNPLNFLNPNDIQSIDILKDASATAIYGSRGANGVIIITTKKGKSGQSSLDYSYSLGVASISKKYDLLNASDFIDAWSSYNPGTPTSTINFGADTDWQDELFRTALTSSHNLSYGGGSESGSYRASISLQDQEGIIETSGMKRLTARFNGDRSFLDDKLKLTTQLTVADIRDDNVLVSNDVGFTGDLVGNIIKLNPTIPARNADGTPYQGVGISNTEPSPLAMVELSDAFTNTVRALGNFTAAYEITDGLKINTAYGIDRSQAIRRDAYSRDLIIDNVRPNGNFPGGRLIYQNNDILNTTWESYLDFNTTTGNIDINAILGYSYQTFEVSYAGYEAAGFRTGDTNIMLNNLASVDLTNGAIVPINSVNERDELQSFFTRGVFSIGEKYIVTATVRTDGSTRFGSDNAYGVFPSGAFKWRLGNEDFMPEALEDMALRVGYGITGNQEFGHNLYTTRQRFGNYDINDGGGVGGGGLSDVSFANPDLKWEQTVQLNIGLDFGLLDGRLTGTLDFYNKVTKDMLIRVDAAQPAPQPFVWKNLDAEVVNTGIDLGLNAVAVDNGDLTWDIAANISYNKNIVNAGPSLLLNTGGINGQGLTGAFAQRIADGQPLYAFFVREFIGYTPDGGSQLYANGDVQDFNGTSPLPKVNAGLTNTVKYGDFSLSVFFAGQFGHYIYSNTGNAFFTAGSIAGGRNVTQATLDPGPNGIVEARTNAPDVSSRFLEKGDFVRLQNVSLSYNVPITSDAIRSLRLFATGQNLAVFTNYSGQDPEVNVDKNLNGIPSFGIDYTTYPRARTFTFGVGIGF